MTKRSVVKSFVEKIAGAEHYSTYSRSHQLPVHQIFQTKKVPTKKVVNVQEVPPYAITQSLPFEQFENITTLHVVQIDETEFPTLPLRHLL